MTAATATIPLGAGAAAAVEPVVPPELGSFEAFLADLQVDLVRALREYNGFPPAGEEGPALAPMTEDDVAGTSEGATEGGEEGAAATGGSAEEEAQARAAAVGGGGTGLGVEPRRLNWMRVYRFPVSLNALPSLPHFPSDILTNFISSLQPRNVQGTLAADRQPASDTVDDAASIPSDGASTSESTLSADPANNAEQTPPVAPTTTRLRDTSVTPMIMGESFVPSFAFLSRVHASDFLSFFLRAVGVRSISRADVQDAFGNGPPRAAAPQPATATRRASTSSLPTPSTSGTPASPASTLDALPRSSSPSLDQDGDAVMDETLPSSSSSSGGPPTPSATNISRLRQAMRSLRDRRGAENGTDEEAVPAAQPLADRAGTRSFVLWVVGGLYSSDHPILAAPGLFGGTLDHDDLWALAELMGQAKPQTATSEAIANSGLEIIKGGMVKVWCEEKKVLENSADRCMVCLGDYEEEEECRILECSELTSLLLRDESCSFRRLLKTDASVFSSLFFFPRTRLPSGMHRQMASRRKKCLPCLSFSCQFLPNLFVFPSSLRKTNADSSPLFSLRWKTGSQSPCASHSVQPSSCSGYSQHHYHRYYRRSIISLSASRPVDFSSCFSPVTLSLSS